MKKPFYESPEFKAEKVIWDEKLAKSGFIDIEAGQVDELVIQPEIISMDKANSGQAYEELCKAILSEYKFRKDIHRVIFTRHAEGLSDKQISEWIKANTLTEFSRKGINDLINRVKENYLKGV